MKYIMVTGSRHATFHAYEDVIREALEIHADDEDWVLVHGGARGVDRIARIVAKELNPSRPPIVFPADWERYHYGAGPIRNLAMTNFLAEKRQEGHDVLCLAFHHDWSKANGTNNAIAYAESAHILVIRHDVVQQPKQRRVA